MGALVGVLALGAGGYAVVASVTAGPATTPTADPTTAAAAPSEAAPSTSAAASSEPTAPSTATTKGRTQTAWPPDSSNAPSATSEPSQSETSEGPLGQLPLESRSATPTPRAATPATSSPSLDDLVAPLTRLVPVYPGPDEALFTFSSNERVSFDCSLDGAAYTSCGSPVSYEDMDPGRHTFSVRATDAAGNVDRSPATTSWNTTGAPAGGE